MFCRIISVCIFSLFIVASIVYGILVCLPESNMCLDVKIRQMNPEAYEETKIIITCHYKCLFVRRKKVSLSNLYDKTNIKIDEDTCWNLNFYAHGKIERMIVNPNQLVDLKASLFSQSKFALVYRQVDDSLCSSRY